MRKLILEEWMSLDGFVADKNGQLDFFTGYSTEENSYSDKEQLHFLQSVDSIILGRKTYELFVDFWPKASTEEEIIADALNSIPKYIVSGTMQHAVWGNWEKPGIISSPLIENVVQLKNRSGKNIVIWGSISIAQALMKAGLIDEYRIQLCPVILGGGRPLFDTTDFHQELTLMELRRYPTGVVFLRYAGNTLT
jgi:dihydrofolate reductase